MPHVIEPATSGRAKCRGCNRKIEKDAPRFGERQPNAFGDGEMTLWFHPTCAALKRPAPFLEALSMDRAEDRVLEESEAAALEAAAELGLEYRRLPRLDGAERAPTARARCRSCRELIDRGSWRLALVFFEEYRFEPAGFIHAACARGYFAASDRDDTVDIDVARLIERVEQLSPELDAEALAELSRALSA